MEIEEVSKRSLNDPSHSIDSIAILQFNSEDQVAVCNVSICIFVFLVFVFGDFAVRNLQLELLQKQREANYPRSRMRLSETGGPSPTPGTTLQWTQLGPQSALSEWHGSYYDGLDSGRVATIRVGVDP